MTDNLVASYPLPFKSNLWAGNTDKIVDPSGTPRKHEGIKSRNMCEIDIAIMNIANAIWLKYADNTGRAAITNAEIRFIWMPGIKPVRIPARKPKINANARSINPNALFLSPSLNKIEIYISLYIALSYENKSCFNSSYLNLF